MAHHTKSLKNLFLLILSAIPFFVLSIVFDNTRYVTLCFIWVGTILLIEPTIIYEAFREVQVFGGLKQPEGNDKKTKMLRRIYGYLTILGGFLLVIAGLVATFI